MQHGGERGERVRRLAAWWWPVLPCLVFAAWQASVGRSWRGQAGIALALGWVIATSFVLWPRIRWLLAAIAPLLAASAFGLVATALEVALAERLATALAAAATAVLVLLALGIRPRQALDVLVHAVGTGLRAVAGGAVFVLLIVPAWLWTRLRRRNPVRPGDTGAPGWSAAAHTAGRQRSLAAGAAAPPPRRTLTGRAAWAVGCVGLVLVLNFAAGWTWDQAFPTTPAAPPEEAAGATTAPSHEITGTLPRDPRNDVPAMAAYPWREQYFDDIQRTTTSYWPFTEYRPRDFTSAYVNQDGWVRRSYEPAGAASDQPTMWMFGGSTTWGEGQRDGYTITSWIARLSEEAGTPLRVRNYGQRGWTQFQEMVLYDQELALRPTPDLAVFYDGANELNAQSLIDEPVPTHVLAYTYAQKLLGATVATKVVDEPADDDPDLWPLVRDEYRKHSAIDKIIDSFKQPADAAPAQDPGSTTGEGAGSSSTTTTAAEPGEGFTGDQEQGADGGVTHYDVTPQDGTDAGQVYRRGKLLTLAASREYGVDTYLFWQPMRPDWEATQRARAEMGSSTIDISHVLDDHPEVFIDGGHTNEEGARIVAEAIWKRIAPAVQEWYDQGD